MRTAITRFYTLSCLAFAYGFLGGIISGQESSPAQVDKIEEAAIGERLTVMHKALETIRQGEVRPPIIPKAHQAGAPVKPSPGQREYRSDLTGIWKMSGWIDLISGQHDCLGLYLNKRGKVKLDGAGQVHFTSIWPNAPERTEVFGTLSDGQTMIRKLPRSSPKYAPDQGAEKELWTETLDRELRAFYHGTKWDSRTTGLTGFWQVEGAEAHLLVTPTGDAWYFQMRNFGRWIVDDQGQILVQHPNEVRPEPYATFHGNRVINDQGDYQNIFEKFEP